jgi:hypothetical protein
MDVMMFDLHLPTPFALMHVPYVFLAHSTLSNFSGVFSALSKAPSLHVDGSRRNEAQSDILISDRLASRRLSCSGSCAKS